MVAAALCGGQRGAQARKVAGWVLWAWSTGDRAVPGSDAEGWRQQDAPGLGESGSGTRRRQRQMGLRGGLGAGSGWTGPEQELGRGVVEALTGRLGRGRLLGCAGR
jgi:hypothetical protein